MLDNKILHMCVKKDEIRLYVKWFYVLLQINFSVFKSLFLLNIYNVNEILRNICYNVYNFKNKSSTI